MLGDASCGCSAGSTVTDRRAPSVSCTSSDSYSSGESWSSQRSIATPKTVTAIWEASVAVNSSTPRCRNRMTAGSGAASTRAQRAQGTSHRADDESGFRLGRYFGEIAIHRTAESKRFLKTCIRPGRCLCFRIGVERPAEGLVSLPRTQPPRPEPSPYRAVLATAWFVIAPIWQKRGKIVRAKALYGQETDRARAYAPGV